MDMEQKKGRASILFEHPPVIKSVGTVSGTREGQGPLGRFFDSVEPDDKMGMENWEEAESAMQEKAAGLALKKGKLTEQEMDYSFAGDLLGQLIATSFGSGSLHVPLFGLYGACSTMGEALGLGAMTVNAGYGKNVLAINQHLARSWHIQRTDHIQQCAFTRTRFSDDCHIFSLRNRKANIPKRFYSSFTAAIGLTNTLDL